MSFLVKDFAPSLQRWVSWVPLSVESAYEDYPYVGNMFPTVSQLSKKLIIVREVKKGISVPESSIWEIDGEDLIPNETVNGHTGAWGIKESDSNVINNMVFPTRDPDGNVVLNLETYPDKNIFNVEENGDISLSPSSTIDQLKAILFDIKNNEIALIASGDIIGNDLVETSTDTDALSSPIDIIPGSTDMPDKFWLVAQGSNETTITLK